MDTPTSYLFVKQITAVDNPCKVAFLNTGQLMIGYDGSNPKFNAERKKSFFEQQLKCLQNPDNHEKSKLALLSKAINTEDKGGACVVNWQTNTKESDIFTNNVIYPFCFRNQQRTAIALNNIFQVASYNPDGKKTWEFAKEFSISTFSASNTLYVIDSDGIVHNSKNSNTFSLPADETRGLMYDQPTAHYSQERIFFTRPCATPAKGTLQSALYTVNIDENGKIALTWKVMPTIQHPSEYGDLPKPYHSPINDTIAFYYPFADQWCLYNPNNNEFIIEDIDNGLCRILAFHPKNSNLLGLLTKDGYGAIYDIAKQTIIMKTEKSLGETTPSNSFNYQMIDFSEDGKYLAVIAGNQCFVLSNIDQHNNL